MSIMGRRRLTLGITYRCTKFDDSSFSRSGDVNEDEKRKMGYVG